MKKYYEEVDILRGIAIILVLLGHSIIVFPVNLNDIPWCGTLHDLASSVHLPLFFLSSGFCFSYRGYPDLLRRKTPRLLIPYLVFTTLNLAAELLLPTLVNEPKPLGELLLNYVTGGAEWFLYTLMIVFLLFPLLIMLGKRKGGTAAACMFLLGLYLYPAWPVVCNLDRLAKYFLYFAAGYVIRTNKESGGKLYFSVEKRIGRPLLSLAAFLLWIGWFFVTRLITIPVLGRASALATACCGMIFWLTLALALSGTKHGHRLAEVGKYSLQLYLFNGYLLTVSRTVLVNILGVTSPLLIIFGDLLVILGISYLLIRTVVAKVKLLRFLTGII